MSNHAGSTPGHSENEILETNKDEQPLACDLTAIPADVREEHVIGAPQLFAAAQAVHELADGYAIRFANEVGRFMTIAKFVENERLCCPFFHFRLEIEPNRGPIWLRLTGAEGGRRCCAGSCWILTRIRKNSGKRSIPAPTRSWMRSLPLLNSPSCQMYPKKIFRNNE